MKIPSARRPLPGTGKPFECPTCGRRVADQRSLRQHVAAAHPVPADEMRCAAAVGEARP